MLLDSSRIQFTTGLLSLRVMGDIRFDGRKHDLMISNMFLNSDNRSFLNKSTLIVIKQIGFDD